MAKNLYCLIDLSYFIFYRYYATIFWFKLSHKKELNEFKETNPDEHFPFFEHKDFIEKFKKQFIDTILKLKKKFIKDGYDIKDSNFILARDCPRKNIWRMKIFPDYKTNRDAKYKTENPALFKIFSYTYNTIIPKVKSEMNIETMFVDKAEADDIVALTSKYLSKIGYNVYIIASDTDYLQLTNNENITIMDLKNRIINKKTLGSAEIDLLVKIISGDTADNIPKCFKKGRIGKKTAFTLATNPNKLELKFEKEPEAREAFLFNKKLIDFNEIPLDLQEQIYKEITDKIIIPN